MSQTFFRKYFFEQCQNIQIKIAAPHFYADLEDFLKKLLMSSGGCGSVGKVFASEPRGQQFESSQCRNFIHLFIIKTKKKKEARNGP